MEYRKYFQIFTTYVRAKTAPNRHEEHLFAKAQEHCANIARIRGIEMIAVCNSLSMYATHEGSDIDLFIITRPRMLWWVRIWVTYYFWKRGLWRHGHNIAGNFCLSFFATTHVQNLEKIAIKNDIYLYYWIHFLKPIISHNGAYEQFLQANTWVQIGEQQLKENTHFLVQNTNNTKSPSVWHYFWSGIMRFFGEKKALRRYHQLGRPEGVIITSDMLKFHDKDQRARVRDVILKKHQNTV